MKDIKKIEAEIKNNNTNLNFEDYVRYIEYKTITKIDIIFCGNFYRITGYKWNTYEDCEFKFIYDSHKAEIKSAVIEFAMNISNNNYKRGCEQND